MSDAQLPPPGGAAADPASAGLDDIDLSILDQLRRVYDQLDPPPGDLDRRVQFAIAVDNLDLEVFRLQDDRLAGAGARSVERSRTVTFDSETLTIMVSIVEGAAGQLRLDGWLAPGGEWRVELRAAGPSPDERPPSRVVRADDTGRFVFDDVARGLVQLLVHPGPDAGSDHATSVVTPSLLL
jgi:hypothetical protein